jgi:hypothetical protein
VRLTGGAVVAIIGKEAHLSNTILSLARLPISNVVMFR